MNAPDRLDLPEIPVPSALLVRVERDGMSLVRRPARPRAPARKLAVDVAMTAFCVGHLVWIARIVDIIP